jgi:alpha-tubulin suppressor-like RCC1 family protein
MDRNKPVVVTPTSGFAQIAAGFNTTCAVTSGNIPYCWGEGDAGQIGNGSVILVNKNPAAVSLP